MPEPTPTNLLPDLAVRQDQVLKELDELNQRIEGVLKGLSPSGGAGVTSAGEQAPAIEGSLINDGGRDVPTC
jgi:hypothetical protein